MTMVINDLRVGTQWVFYVLNEVREAMGVFVLNEGTKAMGVLYFYVGHDGNGCFYL